jgi:hypothetical protein
MRAPRFPLHLSVRYKTGDDAEWHRGETENISRSGVLFRAEHSPGVDTPVELRLLLDKRNGHSEPAEVRCRGRVVRTVPPRDEETWPGAAIVIEQYDFIPPNESADLSPWV